MNLKLTRSDFREDGIFGQLTDDKYHFIASTLEHAYLLDGKYIPKIPDGTYRCIRGEHQLHGMDHPFQTFEVTGIEGHSGLLFHVLNYNDESDGCIGLGMGIGHKADGGRMLVNSRAAFGKFLSLVQGLDEFTLQVESYSG